MQFGIVSLQLIIIHYTDILVTYVSITNLKLNLDDVNNIEGMKYQLSLRKRCQVFTKFKEIVYYSCTNRVSFFDIIPHALYNFKLPGIV